MERKCKNCEYWELLSDDDDCVPLGICHRFPPSINSDKDDKAYSPMPDEDEWCGEFKPKESIAEGESEEKAASEAKQVSRKE